MISWHSWQVDVIQVGGILRSLGIGADLAQVQANQIWTQKTTKFF